MTDKPDGADRRAPFPELSNSKLVSPGQPLPPEPPANQPRRDNGLAPLAPQRPSLEHRERRVQPPDRTPRQTPPDRTPRQAPPSRPRRRIPTWLLVLAPLLLLAGAGAAAYLLTNDDDAAVDTTGNSTATDQSIDDGEATAESSAAADGSSTETSEEQNADSGSAADAGPGLPIPVAPYLEAQLTDGQLELSGIVPSEDIKGVIDQSVAPAYLPAFNSATTVDSSLQTPDWLARASTAVTLFQNGMIDGTMLVSDGSVYLEGTAPNQVALDETIGFITDLTGMPVSADGVEVKDLRGATYTLAASGGDLALSGSLPTEEMRLAVLAAAEQFYDPARIVEATTVDPGVAPALWMYNPTALVAVLSQFPDYEVRLKGDGFDVRLSGANTFESGSAQFTESFVPVLNYGIVVMLRDPAVSMIIEGHTDDRGEEAANLQLSQARADAVAAYITGGGISPDRITSIGKGEAEPVADNSTAEGRSINRRVEFGVSAPTS